MIQVPGDAQQLLLKVPVNVRVNVSVFPAGTVQSVGPSANRTVALVGNVMMVPRALVSVCVTNAMSQMEKVAVKQWQCRHAVILEPQSVLLTTIRNRAIR